MAMREPGFLQTPFGQSGDRAAIPTAVQPGGQVSFPQGWGPDYEKALGTDPAAKAIDRQQTNQLFYLTTLLLQRWQTETFPEWIEPVNNGGNPYPYPRGAVVRVPTGAGDWALRISNKASNTSTPNATAATADWGDFSAIFTGAILGNTTALQTMQGALALAQGSTIGGTRPAWNASDNRVPSLVWTRGDVNSGSYGYGLDPNNSFAWVRHPRWAADNQGQVPFTVWGQLTHIFSPPAPGSNVRYGTRNLLLRDTTGAGLPFAPLLESVSVTVTPRTGAYMGTAITARIYRNPGSNSYYLFSDAAVDAVLYPTDTICNFIINGFTYEGA